jgi:hypothetical protein
MSFRVRDLAVHVLNLGVERGTGCGPCTASPPPEKVPKPPCPPVSKKPGQPPRCQAPSEKPGKDRPAKRSALSLLRQQLRAALAGA